MATRRGKINNSSIHAGYKDHETMTLIKAVSFNFCQGHFLSNEVVALKGALEKDVAMKVG